jgi:hypothetical protein
MSKLTLLATVLMFAVGFGGVGVNQTVAGDTQGVTVTVKGESWDACTRGFAFIKGLPKEEARQTAARRGSRVSVAQAVLSKRDRPVRALAGAAQQGRKAVKRTAQKDIAI